ncbi:hypothetical protein [Nocardia amamiensis]|uniref:hypothetical protein n=1 Tax=Nocardia TaxID=1817 RepID=UPI0033C31538
MADSPARAAASIRGTGIVGAVGGPSVDADAAIGVLTAIGVVSGAFVAGTSGAMMVGAVDTSTTRLAKLAGPSPMLHHKTTRPSGRCSTTMP